MFLAIAVKPVESLEIFAYTEQYNDGWRVNIQLRNTGTVDVIVDNIYINGLQVDLYRGITIEPNILTSSLYIKARTTGVITIIIPSNAGVSSGRVIK